MRNGSITSATGIFSQIESQRRLFDSLYRLSAFQAILDQHERLTSPSALQTMIEQQERWEQLIQGPAKPSMLETIIAQKANIDKLTTPPIYGQILRQQRLFEELVEGPRILRMLAGWSGTMPTGLVGHVAHYREGLVEELSGKEGGVGFDSEALSRFAAEREAILTCLKRFAYIAAAGGYFGVYRIPDVILGLIVVFLVIGEVADEILTERAGDEASAA